METAVKLYVKLKAKVKVGPSWGDLQDLDIWPVCDELQQISISKPLQLFKNEMYF